MTTQQPSPFSVWLARHCSHHTARLYVRWAAEFAAFRTGDELEWGELELEATARDTAQWEEEQSRFIAMLQRERDLTTATVKQVRAALGRYRQYLQSRHGGDDPMREVVSPRLGSCHIELLGGLRVTVDGRGIGRTASSKAGRLLAYLAYYRDRPHRREMLAEILWPETDKETGRSRLKQTLCSLRRQLEPPEASHGNMLAANREEVTLRSEGISLDVADFEAALQHARMAPDAASRLVALEQAVERYGGELLPDHDDVWIVAERERLTRAFLAALRQLVAGHEAIGDLERALTYARRATDADSLCEECHCDLMRLLAATGQVSALSRQYGKLKKLLRAELGTAPTQETRDCARTCRRRAKEVAGILSQRPFPREADEAVPPEQPAGHSEECRLTPRLPPTFTRFFGRESEIVTLLEWLRTPTTRLVTLTGPGGCGKTRLALEVARRSDEGFAGAVCFVALADLSDARLIAPLIAETLGMRPSGACDALDQIAAVLSSRACLLVLDNFEHLVDSGAAVVRDLLMRVPGLVCLVTSRQRLDLEGEREAMVSPLPTPAGDEAPEHLAALSSVQLFRDRAQALRPDFQVTARNAPAVAGLCQALEGLPLALELAAAWIQTLTPYQMLERLQDRFRLMESQRKDIAPRHRTLRATIEASYRLLVPELQRFFTELSVFRGGWTLSAAEQVCQTPLAAEYLAQLRTRSLVTATETPDASEMRFRMLETLREYALEKQSLEDRHAITARHCNYFLQLALDAEPELVGPDVGAWLDRLERDQENLRAALRWTLRQPAPETGLRLAGALWRFWYTRGNANEGAMWLKDLLEIGKDVDVQVRIKALSGGGNIAYSRADYTTSRTYFEEGLALRRETGDGRGIAAFLASLANIACGEQNFGLGRDLLEQSLAVFRQLDDTHNMGLTLANLALVTNYEQDYTNACDLYEQSLTLLRATKDLPNIVVALNNLVSIYLTMGERKMVGPLLHESLTWNETLGNKRGIVYCLMNLVSLHIAEARFYCGAVLLGAIDALRAKNSISISPAAVEEHGRHLEAIRKNLGTAALNAAHAEGLAMTLEQTLAYAHETLAGTQ